MPSAAITALMVCFDWLVHGAITGITSVIHLANAGAAFDAGIPGGSASSLGFYDLIVPAFLFFWNRRGPRVGQGDPTRVAESIVASPDRGM